MTLRRRLKWLADQGPDRQAADPYGEDDDCCDGGPTSPPGALPELSTPTCLTHADLPRLLHSTIGAASLVCSGGVCGGPEELCYRCGVLFSGGGVQGVGDAVQLREGVRDGGIGAGCGE